ncbi:MAG: hypothetical protein R3F30_09725 [Planctomycetota bacterium]
MPSGLAPLGEDRLPHLVARGVAPEAGAACAPRRPRRACALHATPAVAVERRPGDFEDCLQRMAGRRVSCSRTPAASSPTRLGKGLDFAGTVHESAGDDESVARLVASSPRPSGGALALRCCRRRPTRCAPTWLPGPASARTVPRPRPRQGADPQGLHGRRLDSI